MDHNHKNRKVVFSVTNCICYDQRVLKMASAVSSLGFEITIIGRKRGECCETDSIPFKTRRFRMLFKHGFFFYKFYNIRLFFYLLSHRFDLLVANDLDTLLPNYLVSRLKNIPVIYDSHEYFTGVPELNKRPFVKMIWKIIEKAVFPELKHVVTVSDPIAGLYETEYGIRPVVIRNLSPLSENIIPMERDELGVREDHLLLILQGGGINVDRGAEDLIEAVKKTENVSLIIAGAGDVLPVLKDMVMGYGISDRVKFYPLMPWEKLMRITKSADVGLSLDKDTNLNYRYSLPNKLFDYLSAGIPVITGSLPEIIKIVESYACGITLPAITTEEISKAIIKFRDDRELQVKLKRNSKIASETLNWTNESEKVISLYRKILGGHVN
ncbi:MAG TPA: glycosyltransferase [Bacteroidales bacterium]|nr:glycosyltransferase [Bacteroidales bacterium]